MKHLHPAVIEYYNKSLRVKGMPELKYLNEEEIIRVHYWFTVSPSLDQKLAFQVTVCNKLGIDYPHEELKEDSSNSMAKIALILMALILAIVISNAIEYFLK